MTLVTKRIVIEVEYDDHDMDPPEDWDWDLGVSFDAHRWTTDDNAVHARYLGVAS